MATWRGASAGCPAEERGQPVARARGGRYLDRRREQPRPFVGADQRLGGRQEQVGEWLRDGPAAAARLPDVPGVHGDLDAPVQPSRCTASGQPPMLTTPTTPPPPSAAPRCALPAGPAAVSQRTSSRRAAAENAPTGSAGDGHNCGSRHTRPAHRPSVSAATESQACSSSCRRSQSRHGVGAVSCSAVTSGTVRSAYRSAPASSSSPVTAAARGSRRRALQPGRRPRRPGPLSRRPARPGSRTGAAVGRR